MKNQILSDLEKMIAVEKEKAAIIDSLPCELENFKFKHIISVNNFIVCFDAETAGDVIKTLGSLQLLPLELHRDGCTSFDVAGKNISGKNTSLDLPFIMDAEMSVFDDFRKYTSCRIRCFLQKNIELWFYVKNPPFEFTFLGRYHRGRLVKGTAGFSFRWLDEKIKEIFTSSIKYLTAADTNIHKVFYK